MDRTLWFPFSVKLCYVFVSQQQRQLALKTAGDCVFRPEPRTFSGSHRTESLAAGMKRFALCRWLRAKLSLESPENDIIEVLMSCCPEMGQLGPRDRSMKPRGHSTTRHCPGCSTGRQAGAAALDLHREGLQNVAQGQGEFLQF